MSQQLIILLIPALTLFFLVAIFVQLRLFIYVCPPGVLLVFSGRSHTLPDGTVVGYRAVTGGRTLRIPLLEAVQSLDLRVRSLRVPLHGAICKGPGQVVVEAVATVRLHHQDPELMASGIERFLGLDHDEVLTVSSNTLQSQLGELLGTRTAEEVNADRLVFAEEALEQSRTQLSKLGIELLTLNLRRFAFEPAELGA